MHGLQCVAWDVDLIERSEISWDMDLIEGSEISFRGICLFLDLWIAGSWQTF